MGNKLVSMFGCGAVALATYDAYMKGKPITKEELKIKQQKIFNKYLQGPISAYRFKLGAHLFFRLNKEKNLQIKVKYNLTNSIKSLAYTLSFIKKSIDNDIPVPLIVGLKIRNGYKNNLRSHWVTITGYSKNGDILISNNGRMESIRLDKLLKNRLFIGTIFINKKYL